MGRGADIDAQRESGMEEEGRGEGGADTDTQRKEGCGEEGRGERRRQTQ